MSATAHLHNPTFVEAKDFRKISSHPTMTLCSLDFRSKDGSCFTIFLDYPMFQALVQEIQVFDRMLADEAEAPARG